MVLEAGHLRRPVGLLRLTAAEGIHPVVAVAAVEARAIGGTRCVDRRLHVIERLLHRRPVVANGGPVARKAVVSVMRLGKAIPRPIHWLSKRATASVCEPPISHRRAVGVVVAV